MKKRFISSAMVFLLFSVAVAQDGFEISLKNNNEREVQTKAQLQRLLKQSNISKWIFTRKVLIESRASPHSHPVLTVNTRYLDNDLRFLSMFIHEQIHWFASSKFRQVDKAIEELKVLYPEAPDGPPEGARNKGSTYLHLIVCHLEYEALKELAGSEKARSIIEEMSGEYYKWIYRTVLADGEKIERIVGKYNLKV